MTLPLEYRWFRAHGLCGLSPWHFLDNLEEIDILRKEYLIEVGRVQDLYPFARRYDMDDIAGFAIVDGSITNTVVEVHLTWSARKEDDGYPLTIYYGSFSEWLTKSAIPETETWISEEQLEEYLQEQRQKQTTI